MTRFDRLDLFCSYYFNFIIVLTGCKVVSLIIELKDHFAYIGHDFIQRCDFCGLVFAKT